MIPGCCQHGWRITLAGSRYLKPAETRYAAVEGEALAIAWSLEQTRFFTQGYDNLVVVTDHRPLVHLFSNRTLDQITNSRLFSLKQRTLPWRFTVHYMPGKGNCFSDAASRYPASGDSDSSDISDSEVLAGIMLDPEEENDIAVAPISSHSEVRVITWDLVKEETSKDKDMMHLTPLIQSEFPEDKKNMPLKLQQYWDVRNKYL